MIRDPLFRPPEGCPYEALAAAGITPHSSHKEVMDALFPLMERGPVDDKSRRAWDRLRNIVQRLQVDFFFYHATGPAEAPFDSHDRTRFAAQQRAPGTREGT